MKPVTHLHFHTEYSLQDSLVRIDQLAGLIERFNVKALAMTDHGTVDGAVKFYQEVKKTNAAPLLGCEFYVVDDLKERESKHRYHMTALAKNRDGFTSIMKALTVANLDGLYYKPRIDWEYIFTHMHDIVVMTACRDGILSHPNWDKLLPIFLEKFGEDFYLEAILIKDHKPQFGVNDMVKSIQEGMGLKVAFTNDVHYLEPKDWKAREVVRAISYNFRIDPNMKPEIDQADIYMKDYDQMVASMKAFGWNDEAAMTAVWDEIADKCTFPLEEKAVSIPVAYPEAKADPAAYLRKVCEEAFVANDKLCNDEKALERMEYELAQIIEGGFAEYFLLVQDMIRWAKTNGCKVGPGRGSVGGSLVAFIMGITQVNPLDYDLAFERFISPGRHDLPDIDIDFEDTERIRVIEYMRGKYGANKVAYVSTFANTKGRGSVRDVGRVFDVPLIEVDRVAKQILVRSGGDARADFTVEDTVTLFENAKDFHSKYPYVIDTAKVIEGLVKTKGIHAAGLVVDVTDLYNGEKCVLSRTKDGEIAVNWDKKDLEYMGMMKIDALGLKTLNVLSRIEKSVLERKKEQIDFLAIPFDEEKVFDLFRKADSVGVFQFGSAGMMQYLREFKPINFKELYQVNALWRPGTLRSGLASEFILLKNGEKKPTYISTATKKILEETHGIVLFQEQVMYMLNRLGDVPWRTTDIIRKVVSKSEGQEKFETFRQLFLEGVRRLNSMTEEEANKVFSLMKYFGSYGFNKSHSVEYTVLGYWTMWMKVHYPIEFYCASLQRADDKTDITELLNDANRHGLQAKLPNINKSDITWRIEDDKTLRAGLDIIKGISSRIAEDIFNARQTCGGQFKDFWEFRKTVTKRIVNVGKVKVLLVAKAFSDITDETTRKKLLVYISDNKSLPEDEAQLKDVVAETEIAIDEDVFNFEMTEDYFGSNKKFIEVLTQKFGIKKLTMVGKSIDTGVLPFHWYLGKFDEMKYGYRTRVAKSADSKGYATDLGGVYGVFRDDTYHAYATVTGELYHNPKKKALIEEAAGRIVLMWANKPSVNGSLFASRIYLLDDIKAGDFDDLEMGGIVGFDGAAVDSLVTELKVCAACAGRKDCKAPVPFSPSAVGGAMIVGEAPGGDEDREGKGFTGRAGKILWDTMAKQRIDRDCVHVTNVLKCRPKDNKITDQSVVNFCGVQWLRKEIEATRPKLILSLGKTALRFFTGNKDASIMERNGQVEWNERVGAWMVWGVHPAMVLYGAENQVLLDTAVAKFGEMFSRLLG